MEGSSVVAVVVVIGPSGEEGACSFHGRRGSVWMADGASAGRSLEGCACIGEVRNVGSFDLVSMEEA